MSEEKNNKPELFRWLKGVWLGIRVPLAAVLLALIIGGLILLISGINPLDAYGALVKGAFGNAQYLQRTLEKATPLIFSGLAVAFAFKAGLFNIGAQGQLLFGAITAATLGFLITGLPALVHIPLSLLGGALVGALYGAIPGALKTFTGAHEVITTIMLNYIALNITDFLADGPLKDESPGNIVARTPRIADSAVIPTPQIPLTNGLFIVLLVMGLAALTFFVALRKQTFKIKSQGLLNFVRVLIVIALGVLVGVVVQSLSPVFFSQAVSIGFLPYDVIPLPVGFLIAIVMAVLVWFLLMRTSLGFEIRTIGLNQHAAKYAGIKVRLIFILAMVISGFLAGMGGAVETQGVVYRYQPGFNVGLGFDGITIALLGRNHPLGVIPAALLVGAMKGGGNVMQFEAKVPAEIIDVIQALMLFFVAADMIVRWVIRAKAKPDQQKIKLTSGWGSQ